MTTPLALNDPGPNVETPLGELDGLVSPDRFYVRCNFPVPRIDAGSWRLEVGGDVDHRRTWTLDELATLPGVERTVTLECAGNGRTRMTPVPPGTPWGLGAVGTSRFGGVRLSDVLLASGPKASTTQVVFTGADRGSVEPDGEIAYEFNLEVGAAMSDGPILAWAMGDAPLTPEHGFPLRLVVPGEYGMRSVKWLTRITAVQQPFQGHFVRKYRYRGERGVADGTPVGRIRVRSLFTSPPAGIRVASGPVPLRGIAWSGHAAIARVEIGTAEGWAPATMAEAIDGTGPVSWSLEWTPARSGRHTLAVRATDAAGFRQPTEPVWNEGGYGNNVVHRIWVDVG